MEAESQRDVLMKELGMKEMPELTEAENAFMELIEKTENENKPDTKVVFESRENKIFPEIPRFIFSLKYKNSSDMVNGEILRQDYHRTKTADDYFTKERTKGVKKLIRTDLFNMVRQDLQAQNWYIHMQPVLDAQAAVLFSKEYKAQAGAGYDYWKDQIDIVARRGYSAKSEAIFGKTEKALRESRINLNKAVMGYKASTAVMQIFSVFDAMALAVVMGEPKAALKTIPNVIQTWLFKNTELYKMSKVLQMRAGGEQAFKEIVDKGFGSKYAEYSFKPLKEADLRTALGVMQTYYDALGGTADKLHEAELKMLLSQGGNNIVLRPHILSAYGELSKTALTFQTFFLNRWGVVAEDIISNSIIHGNARQKIRGLNALAIIIAASIVEDDVREYLWSLLTGKHYQDVSTLKRVLSAIPESIPLVGRAISAEIQGRQGDTDVPIVRMVKRGAGGALDIVRSDDNAKKIQGAFKALETIISVRYGIAGTAQIADEVEALLLPETEGQVNQQKAYYNRKIAEAYIKGDKLEASRLRKEAREKGYQVSEQSINKRRKDTRKK